jgi:hypothetical protein
VTTNCTQESKIDRLADALASGMTVPEAAVRLGITSAYANALLQRMRKQLGE